MSVCVCRLEPEYYFPVFVPETAASMPYIPKVKYKSKMAIFPLTPS